MIIQWCHSMDYDEVMGQGNPEDWLSPMNKLIWFEAFTKRLTHVKLRDGRKFTITYKHTPDYEVAKVAPMVGYIPRGTFELKIVTNLLWLTENKGAVHSGW